MGAVVSSSWGPPLTPGQKKDQQKADNENTAAGKKKKVTAAQLRVQRGMSTWP